MKSFRFKQFNINQSKKVFRIGTDAVLLGALAEVEDCNTILEVGVGTGIISLMLAQRNENSIIKGVEINEDAFNLAKINLANSPFSRRMGLFLADFNLFETTEKFDLIVSNPPYFEPNTSSKDILARQKVTLNFKQLIDKSCQYLSEKGKLSVIIPSIFGVEIENLAKEASLFLTHRVNIYGIEGGGLKRYILTFSKENKRLKEEDFVIEKSPRKYSDQYLERTKAFHVFSE